MDDIHSSGQSAVLACSALKRRYRSELLAGHGPVELVFLVISPEEDEARLQGRKGHFFHQPLMASQYADLELPEDEPHVHPVRVGERPAGQVASEVIGMLGLTATDSTPAS
jgi:gluconokinase